jgi:hypothetical protein
MHFVHCKHTAVSQKTASKTATCCHHFAKSTTPCRRKRRTLPAEAGIPWPCKAPLTASALFLQTACDINLGFLFPRVTSSTACSPQRARKETSSLVEGRTYFEVPATDVLCFTTMMMSVSYSTRSVLLNPGTLSRNATRVGTTCARLDGERRAVIWFFLSELDSMLVDRYHPCLVLINQLFQF